MKKTEKNKTTKIAFFLKPYVRNGLFERKIILVRHLFSKKIIKSKILLKKLQKQKKGKTEK